MSRTDEDIEDLLRQDASAQLNQPSEVPDLHQSMTAVLDGTRKASSQTRSRSRSALLPLAAAAAVAVLVATPILLIQHNRTGHQAQSGVAHSATPKPDPNSSSSCASGVVQAITDGQTPLPLLSCNAFAIGAYPGNNKLPALTVKLGATVQISGTGLYRNSRLSLTPNTAASLTQTAAQQWRLVTNHTGQITVLVTSAGLCRDGQQPCGLLTVTVTP